MVIISLIRQLLQISGLHIYHMALQTFKIYNLLIQIIAHIINERF